MIIGDGKRQQQPRLDSILARHGLPGAATKSEDGHFGFVHNRREMRAADAALVREGEGAPFEFLGGDLPVAGFLGEVLELAR